jgi:hypothetical protein
VEVGMTYEQAFERAKQRTETGNPTVPQSVHGGLWWITRPVQVVSSWPRGIGGSRIQTLEEAAGRAKASTEAGRPQIVAPAGTGGYRVRDVPFSMPLAKRGERNAILGRDRRLLMPPDKVKLSEEAVTEAREYYKAGFASMRELARRRDVGYSTIWQAIHGVTWADVA